MTRILEFQPTDEHTVVARVLVELHQAIDLHFPGATPSARQFTKTVLTNHAGESTRIDNAIPPPTPAEAFEGMPAPARENSSSDAARSSQFSMTPKTGVGARKTQAPLATDELQQLMGETSLSRRLRKVLVGTLVAGIVMFVWIYFGGMESLPKFGS